MVLSILISIPFQTNTMRINTHQSTRVAEWYIFSTFNVQMGSERHINAGDKDHWYDRQVWEEKESTDLAKRETLVDDNHRIIASRFHWNQSNRIQIDYFGIQAINFQTHSKSSPVASLSISPGYLNVDRSNVRWEETTTLIS